MTCNQGSLSTIRNPTEPADCGCECDMTDLTYTGESFPCFDIVPGSKLDVFLTRIGAQVCEMDTDITVTDIDFDCIPNTTAPTGGTVSSVLQWFADELIPKSGNDCNCPVTNNIFFTDTYGIVQCDGGQDSGYLKFDGDYANLNADTQVRISADLKITNGFGAGYTELSSSTDLSVVNTDQLNYSYGFDCTGGSYAISLPSIAAASLDHKNRRFSIRRLDCTVANTGTIQAFAGETIEGAGSITLGVGHGYIIQADDLTTDWVIVAEYYGGCDAIEQQNNGNVFMNYKLGVGDSTPDAKVDISNATTTDVTLIVENTGAASADLVQVVRNGTTTDVIDEAGRLHVGGSNPSAELHVTGEGATSATYSLIVENSAGSDAIVVRNDGRIDLRTGTDELFRFEGGDISTISDAGIIRDWTLTGDMCTLSYTRFDTANTNLSPGASTTDTFFDITVTGTDSAGTNELSIFDVSPTWNLTGTATGNTVAFRYSPTFTNTQGNDYGVVVDSDATYNGFGIAAPVSTLESGGSFGLEIDSVAVDTTLNDTHSTVLVDTTAGSVTITLPAAATCAGRIYTIKKIIAANTCTIDGNGAEQIDGAATVAMSNQYAVRMIQSNGSAWYILSSI